MTNEELQGLTEKISLEYFGRTFIHTAQFNSRLRSVAGRYLLKNSHIEINEKYYREYGMDELIQVIKHELCHYHLHRLGSGYKHRDKSFKELMRRVGAPRYCKPLKEAQKRSVSKRLYIYKCVGCGLTYNRKRRVNTTKYCCGKCKGKLQIMESVVL